MIRRDDALHREEPGNDNYTSDRMQEGFLKMYREVLEANKMEDHRPWGYYEVLSDRSDHKVKRIVVFPGKRLSLQRHRRRAEHWTVVSGNPLVRRDDEEITLKPGDSIDIPRRARHRVSNRGQEPVVFIEVQTGEYFGEDDIERFEDDYGRVASDAGMIQDIPGCKNEVDSTHTP